MLADHLQQLRLISRLCADADAGLLVVFVRTCRGDSSRDSCGEAGFAVRPLLKESFRAAAPAARSHQAVFGFALLRSSSLCEDCRAALRILAAAGRPAGQPQPTALK